MLAYYKKAEGEGKGKEEEESGMMYLPDFNNCFCISCDFQSNPEKQSAFIRRKIAEIKKQVEKHHRFPDEYMANAVSDIRQQRFEFTEGVQ